MIFGIRNTRTLQDYETQQGWALKIILGSEINCMSSLGVSTSTPSNLVFGIQEDFEISLDWRNNRIHHFKNIQNLTICINLCFESRNINYLLLALIASFKVVIHKRPWL